MRSEKLFDTIKPKRINQLTQGVYNQIAAGEVIERPASLVKELIENSIDAGATKINIDILASEVLTIRVCDNGHGIHKDDLIKSLSPHATSKLQQANDLVRINTLGFRGEALASICSVAKIKISSTYFTEQQGWSIEYKPDDLWPPLIKQQGHPLGTTVVVQDLFYNTPARRAFLRSDKTELLHIEEVVKKIALGNQQLRLTLRHQEKEIFSILAVSSAELSLKRFGKILGRSFLQNALPINSSATELSLTGFIVNEHWHRSQADRQFLYVNRRYVKDKVLQHAIRQAYAERLPVGRYPIYVLFLQLPAEKIDVNVHPTKHEIRFKEMRLVHQFVCQVLKSALGDTSPSTISPVSPGKSQLPSFSNQDCLLKEPKSLPLSGHQILPKQIKGSNKKLIFWGIFAQEYLIAKEEMALFLIDGHACLSQMAKQIFLQRHEQKIIQKKLLLPQSIQVAAKLESSLSHAVEFFRDLGIELTCVGDNQWWLRAIPAVLHETQIEKLGHLIARLFPEVSSWKTERTNTFIEELSCFAAPLCGHQWAREEIENILYFVSTATPQKCCHARLSWRTIHASELSNVINFQK